MIETNHTIATGPSNVWIISILRSTLCLLSILLIASGAVGQLDANNNKIEDSLEFGITATADTNVDVIVLYNHTQDALPIGSKVKYNYKTINATALNIPRSRLQELAEGPHVEMVYHDHTVHACLDSSVHVIRADIARTAYNLNGSNITIAILDTGIDATHESLDDLDDDPATDDPKVIAFKDFIGHRTDPYDDNGHGTHCAGIAAGTGGNNSQYVGVAPGANLVSVKVLGEDGLGSISNVTEGIEWCIEHKDRYGIRILSLSLGGGGANDGTTPIERVCDAAVDSGLVVCVAAGNEGSEDATVGNPACAKKVITVGSVDDSMKIASSSSRGPTTDGRIKPEVCVVGVSVTSSKAGGGYETRCGTSMAVPQVAGVAALMLEHNPDLRPLEVRSILMNTATDCGIPGPDNTYGWGVVNTTYAISARSPDIRIVPVNYTVMLRPNSFVVENLTINNTGTLPLSFNIIDSMESIPYNWIEGVNGGTNLKLGDDNITSQNLPFAFNFYGRNYTSINISSDGWVSFTSGDEWRDWMYNRGKTIPVCSWENTIFPLGDDWDPGADGGVYLKSYPQMYVITWYQVPHWYDGGSTGDNTFEMVLYETGEIGFNYMNIENPGVFTVGINLGDGLHGTVYEDEPQSMTSLWFGPERWLSIGAKNGTVVGCGEIDIPIAINTADLDCERYRADILIRSNDPNESSITIPVNLSVQWSASDAAIALQVAAHGEYEASLDLNSDGKVTSLDALMILQAAVGGAES